jgi:hypothetical protein
VRDTVDESGPKELRAADLAFPIVYGGATRLSFECALLAETNPDSIDTEPPSDLYQVGSIIASLQQSKVFRQPELSDRHQREVLRGLAS